MFHHSFSSGSYSLFCFFWLLITVYNCHNITCNFSSKWCISKSVIISVLMSHYFTVARFCAVHKSVHLAWNNLWKVFYLSESQFDKKKQSIKLWHSKPFKKSVLILLCYALRGKYLGKTVSLFLFSFSLSRVWPSSDCFAEVARLNRATSAFRRKSKCRDRYSSRNSWRNTRDLSSRS